jgi:hypothetical protein
MVDQSTSVSRRKFLATSSVTVFGTIAVGSGAALLDPKGAWAMTLTTLKPQTMATLILMARDTYPHDRLTDAVYANAVSGYDGKAAADPAIRKLIEDGCADLDKRAQAAHHADYVNVGWESERVSLLRAVQDKPFFSSVRAGLVTGIYDQHDIWQKFGYEGSSAEKGGYLHRGFNDIAWLQGTQGTKS